VNTTPRREIPFGRPWLTDEDRQAVLQVLEGPILTHGPQGKAFESEFAAALGDGAHCVSLASGMAALHLAYLGLGIGPGDDVLVPAQTHTATVHAVEWVGARPVFVDCEPATGNVSAAALERALTPQTRAIALVHFLGIPCDMDAILAVAARRELKVIEDCALALGTRWGGRHVGLLGDAGCFSFYPAKHITTGEGGMFVTRHRELAEVVGRTRAFGVDRTHAERTVPGYYDVPTLGLNYRMSEMQAALGRVQLRRLPEILRRRRANFEVLARGLEGSPDLHILQSPDPRATTSDYCLSVVLQGRRAPERNRLIAGLNAAGVGTSIYYPHPIPRLGYYTKKYGYDAATVPQAAAVSDHSIALPVGPHLTPDDMGWIAGCLHGLLKDAVAC
jgi:dTDP-4-amino-4,6-dideoxygalactose transaminase